MELTLQLVDCDERLEEVFTALISTHGNLSQEDASELLSVSPNHFSHEFKRLHGSSFREARLRVKLSIAEILLRSTNLRVSEIAYKLGYRDLRYFSRMFKREHGITPSEYRNDNGTAQGHINRNSAPYRHS